MSILCMGPENPFGPNQGVKINFNPVALTCYANGDGGVMRSSRGDWKKHAMMGDYFIGIPEDEDFYEGQESGTDRSRTPSRSPTPARSRPPSSSLRRGPRSATTP
eukprot:423642-Karenia_brevis.AAC.1